MHFFFYKRKNFSTNNLYSNIQKDIFFSFKHAPLSQKTLKVVENYKAPIGDYLYTNQFEKNFKIENYMFNLKRRLYFYKKNNQYINYENNKNFLLNSTQKKFYNLEKKMNISKFSKITLSKLLLFYFSFNLSDSWYKQSKISRYIKRLYFFETGYRYNKNHVSNYMLKNIYSHSLFNGVLRILLLEKKLNKNLSKYIHPFLDKIKIILSNDECSDKKIDFNKNNDEIIINFFIDLISQNFLKDNYVFFKEFELDLNKIIDTDYKYELKNNNSNKLRIFLINFFIKDFLFFLEQKENYKYLNYNKKIFNVKRVPHSFFLIPK